MSYPFNEQYTYLSHQKLESLKSQGIEIYYDKSIGKYSFTGKVDTLIDRGFVIDSQGYIVEYISKDDKVIKDNKFISTKAIEIVQGARNEQYGNPVESFKKISQLASLKTNKEITTLDCVRVLQAVKEVRESYKHKEDNLIDLIGYIEIENMIINSEK